jgi:hypothetical protein
MKKEAKKNSPKKKAAAAAIRRFFILLGRLRELHEIASILSLPTQVQLEASDRKRIIIKATLFMKPPQFMYIFGIFTIGWEAQMWNENTPDYT